jgi:hypothetical protein
MTYQHYLCMLRQNYRHSMNHFGQYFWIFCLPASLAISEQCLGGQRFRWLDIVFVHVLKGSSKVGQVHRPILSSLCNRYLRCTISVELQLAEKVELQPSQPTCIGACLLYWNPEFNPSFNCASGWLDVWHNTIFCCGPIRDRWLNRFVDFQLPLRKRHAKP